MTKPLAIDLFCGLGGWTEGLLAEGYDVVGFDIEQHVYGEDRYPGMLCIQDVLTLHGSQFKNAALIVASPPCQEFSYMAMPWTRAKQIRRALLGQGDFPEGYKGSRTTVQLTALFDACFRLQREACAAAGRHIPLVVENVRGAEPWVGKAQWHYGSFYLWGDVPALMPLALKAHKLGKNGGRTDQTRIGSDWTMQSARAGEGLKNPGFRFDGSGKSFQTESVNRGVKTVGHVNKRDGHGHTRHLTNQAESDSVKNGGDWFSAGAGCSLQRRAGSKSSARKAASARIAKIPLALAQHIAHVYHPARQAVA